MKDLYSETPDKHKIFVYIQEKVVWAGDEAYNSPLRLPELY